MNTRITSLSVLATILLLTLTAMVEAAAEPGPAITYQGQLKQEGVPANGNFDMEFRLFDAPALGNQLGDPMTLNAVAVSSGLFTVTLNANGEFGPSAFVSKHRWLEITIDATTFAPRQALTAAPFAVTALNILGFDRHSLDAADGEPTDALFVDDVGHVGIGTQAPVAGLHVEGPGYPNSFLFLNSTGGNNDSGLRLMRDGDVYWHVFNRESTGDSFTLHNALFDPILVATQDGRLGIGTSDPTEPLDVAGVIRSSTGGFEYPDGTLQTTAASGNITEVIAGSGLSGGGAVGSVTLFIAEGGVTSTQLQDGTVANADLAADAVDSAKIADGTVTSADLASDAGSFDRVSGGVMVASGGNIGIGTDAPEKKLDVNGAARTTTLEITGGSPLTATLVAWGNNEAGQLNLPQDRFDAFVAVAAGDYHSLAIHNDGTLSGWGQNDFGQSDVPPGTFIAIAAGWGHSLAIRTDGPLAGWGNNGDGRVDVPNGTFVAVAAGAAHSLAIGTDGTLVGWGHNVYGQIDVPSGTFLSVAAGGWHSLAVRDDGTLVGWGLNDEGQIDVPTGTFNAVAAGYAHGLAIRSDGTLAAWGQNDHGQTDVPPGIFASIAAGEFHNLALRNDGTLVGWGYNLFGQTDVPTGTFTRVAAGLEHSLAIRSDAPAPDPALRLLTDSAIKPGSNTWTIFSDRRLKKNIEPLSGALEHLLQLRGVTFNWIDPATQGGITGTQMGLIADEVQRAFPQWVGRDSRGYQTLTVGGFEALTAEALRELRAEKDRQLDEKDREIAKLREMMTRTLERIDALEGGKPLRPATATSSSAVQTAE